MSRRYQVHEFAALAEVTAKALRQYDRLRLLKPSRTVAGYRVYAESDVHRLEQIVALKFLGLPLKQIKRLLDRGAPLSKAFWGNAQRSRKNGNCSIALITPFKTWRG